MKKFLLALLILPTLTLSLPAANPILTDTFTADPAALVVGDTVYLYAGHDQANPTQRYVMHEWLVYSSKDMKTWTPHGSPLKPTDFTWAKDEAWASQVMEKNGKFYWFVATETKPRGKGIGVAVADSPLGPWKDALGKPLISPDMTKDKDNHGWEDIDPSVFTEPDGAGGATYLFWGNRTCYFAKLKPNLTELDGPIQIADVPNFTEAPWIHKKDNTFYLSYATGFPEKIAYATSDKITGPWTYKGILAEVAGNSNTIHQSIIEFKGQWYFIYHNGALQAPKQEGGSYRRSVCIDYLYHNPDGTLKRIQQTTEGLDLPPEKP